MLKDICQYMKKLSLYFLLLLLIAATNVFAFDIKDFQKEFKLLPQPQKIELLNGKGISENALQFIFLNGEFSRPVLYGVLKSLPLTNKAAAGVLELKLSADNDVPQSSEGYVLEINDNKVTITARSETGLFYGCATLSQLLQDAHDKKITIPSCRITDYPEIAYRAIHLDLKHHLDAGHYYYDMIDRLAQIKINAIIVEFEDKLRYRKSPLVGASDAISIEEFAATSKYAKERNIEISPLVQGLGHASFILKHPEYKDLRDDTTSDWSFDPLNPKTYDLQFSLYEDAIAATPYGKYLHVGGDEVGNLGMSALAKKSGLSPIQLQMMWLNKVCEFAKQHDRIPIFWDDMVFKLSDLYQTTWDPEVPVEKVKTAWVENQHKLDENINLFPKTCVYMRWNYDTPGLLGNQNAIDWYKSHNLMVMAATAAQTMWPIMPREHSNFQPIKEFCKITAEKKMNGILCTAWDDCSPHFETYWRGFYDFAFFSWHYTDAKLEDVHAIFRHRFYSPALSDSSFEFEDLLEKALPFWETALLEKGDRNNYHKDFQLIQLPDKNKPGVWSEKYKSKIEGANSAIKQYELIKDRIEKAKQLTRRNEYHLMVMKQINELQIYSAKLLLLLQKFDEANSTNKQTAKEALGKYVNDFSEVRKDFEDIYSMTRILNNPDDYVLDQNHHEHLANGTKNDDWMFVYELAMNKKIGEWLKE